MGGSITMIIRENENTIHKMCRWTNSFPSFIKSPKFLNKDKEHLANYLKVFLEMQDDYIKNKDSGNFEHNMTDLYIPESGVIAPVEYGIIFIDWVSNQIISTQGYSSVDHFDFVRCLIAYNQAKDDVSWQEDIDDMNTLFTQGKLSLVSNLRDQRLPISKEFKNLMTAGPDLVKSVVDSKMDSLKLMECRLKIDMSPFTVKSYNDDAEGVKQALVEIKKLVSLTEAEENQWQQFIKDRFD